MGGGLLGPLASCGRSSPRAVPWRARQGDEVGGASGGTSRQDEGRRPALQQPARCGGNVEGGVQPRSC